MSKELSIVARENNWASLSGVAPVAPKPSVSRTITWVESGRPGVWGWGWGRGGGKGGHGTLSMFRGETWGTRRLHGACVCLPHLALLAVAQHHVQWVT
jgi:hypothetical protein